MRPHQCADIERLEAIEQAAPDDRHDAGRRQQLRKTNEAVGLQLAALWARRSMARIVSITREITSR